MPGGAKHTTDTYNLLTNIDVLITGRYIEAQKDITNNNLYRGSINQRIVDCQTSLKTGTRILIKGLPNNYNI
jgi:anaerobic ribonucleoside-triphosphate reductase activating protein